ncbi:hypothetical protein A2767_07635 [Candidatus Roizmanbacteria bacterium RIFCSPHIGHO2_01_FULL_35_10]|uniref:Glycosyl transferase family 1 domain-containing protein n=1 Tax=Candidatus Roizmanbacteria bacterium RIFCSPLOWO2_01_FULL_35_13 TaxID=1802055 RepID=A0A1F7ICQ2_9BACT|nr:MAG: hypothetical protein A2767_07635 [Candidatus Roizmanbacteria bacterium RIFCSPHIGHO2_01_FULL_35_10]OGK41139.1 MAG: hypothetical protein A3A74_02235 [Candidatus Roizmanbacteria bacterium RIFCSPLOWO2_01_FULL_35_13]
MIKIALINPRYHPNIFDGGEMHVRKLVSHFTKFADVTVLTTKAIDKESWKDEVDEVSKKDCINIIRFSSETDRNARKFNDLTHSLYADQNPKIKDLTEWIKQVGPYTPSFYEYLQQNFNNYDLFFFVGYNNAFTYFGLPLVKQKAVLIPLTHKEAMLRFNIFDRIFSSPRIIIPSSEGEKKIIQERFNSLPPLFIVGIDVNKPTKILKNTDNKIKKPYCIYIGRISRFKGTWELIEKFMEFKSHNKSKLNLVLIGENNDFIKIPKRKDIIHIPKVSEIQKFSLLADSEFIINSSYYESVSLILLEAWQVKKPVLVNGKCDVLKSQVIQSDGGLFYENYKEFEAMILWLNSHSRERSLLGKNGFKWAKKNYSEIIIRKKLESLVNAMIN